VVKLFIAETGAPPEELSGRWPRYGAQFGAMLEGAGGGFETVAVDVENGALLPEPEPSSALLVTGSPKGSYEEHAFIPPLEEAVRRWAGAHRPVVGICFGHQLVAQAFGARVEKSEMGWGVGVHTHEILGETPWGEGPDRIACAVSHQDQVTGLPECLALVAGSPFCPHAVLRHRDLPVLTFQAHPEFTHDYAAALLTLRQDRIPQDRVRAGLRSLRNETDRDLIAGWIRTFLMSGA
jgi:GMP synthase-like glutamine amidotransferase